MAQQPNSTSKHHGRNQAHGTRRSDKRSDQVHVITGASESVVADSERKNRIYAALIGVRIASLFVVLVTEGWVQIAVFVGGMLAPWIGVQIANNIRQVSNRSITTVPPQHAAIAAATASSGESAEDTVIIGDVVDDQAATPSAESSDTEPDFDEDTKDYDDARS